MKKIQEHSCKSFYPGHILKPHFKSPPSFFLVNPGVHCKRLLSQFSQWNSLGWSFKAIPWNFCSEMHENQARWNPGAKFVIVYQIKSLAEAPLPFLPFGSALRSGWKMILNWLFSPQPSKEARRNLTHRFLLLKTVEGNHQYGLSPQRSPVVSCKGVIY